MRLTGLLRAAACIVAMAASAVQADSLWDHNGSVMRLLANGDARVFVYENPRSGIAAEGVRPGTVLFEGRREGARYIGTARVFSRQCAQPMTFFMAGRVEGERRVVLEGWRPEFRNCRPTGGEVWERLVFDYLRQAGGAPPVQGGSGSVGAVLSRDEVIGVAVDVLFGDPYGRSWAEVRENITDVRFGAVAPPCGPGRAWTVRVQVPAWRSTVGFDIDGVLVLSDPAADILCTTLPLLD